MTITTRLRVGQRESQLGRLYQLRPDSRVPCSGFRYPGLGRLGDPHGRAPAVRTRSWMLCSAKAVRATSSTVRPTSSTVQRYYAPPPPNSSEAEVFTMARGPLCRWQVQESNPVAGQGVAPCLKGYEPSVTLVHLPACRNHTRADHARAETR